ncbi:MAG: hypothetical protein JO072_04145 [Parafilimonas sp.]|nr:hypothetical protein [Parafilimonas sp.]
MDKKLEKDKELVKQVQTSNDTKAAEKAAEADIEKDLDLTPPPDPGDDLDEGELARLEGED